MKFPKIQGLCGGQHTFVWIINYYFKVFLPFVFLIHKFGQNIWNKLKKSSKIGQSQKIDFWLRLPRVYFWKVYFIIDRLSTRQYLNSLSKFPHDFLFYMIPSLMLFDYSRGKLGTEYCIIDIQNITTRIIGSRWNILQSLSIMIVGPYYQQSVKNHTKLIHGIAISAIIIYRYEIKIANWKWFYDILRRQILVQSPQ